MGLWGIPPWKVQAFPRTFHAAPHHTTFCGLLAWKVILFFGHTNIAGNSRNIEILLFFYQRLQHFGNTVNPILRYAIFLSNNAEL